MVRLPIYLDNHATTRVDPRVLEAMLPYFGEIFGNSGSTTHEFGHAAKEAVDQSREVIARSIGSRPKEIVFTSGATESNNLAIRGVAEHHAAKGRHIVSVATEHPAVLDPLKRLGAHGFEVTLLPVTQSPDPGAGLVRIEQVAEAIRDDTILVSVMLANSEIGAIPPLAEIGRLCHQRGILLHSDATQAVGRIPVDVEQLGVDLMSFSAHKMYGPKGIGALYVRSRGPRVRLDPLVDGGGQEGGLRSGTLNVPGIVGFAHALQLCLEEMDGEILRLRTLRDRLYAGLSEAIPGVSLNGPALEPPENRLPGNLNVSFANVVAESLVIHMKDVAVSTVSACSSADPRPSHVLVALGLPDEAVHAAIRFGLGRFNTAEEIDLVIAKVVESITQLRAMSCLAD